MSPKPSPASSDSQPCPTKARILIVEDHPIVQEGLAAVINREPDLITWGSAPSASAALAAVQKLAPDLALVDVSLEASHGIELVKNLMALNPGLPVLMLSTHDEALYAERSLRAGARGYVMKREPSTKLLEAIRKVLGGGLWFSEAITSTLLQGLSAGRRAGTTLPLQTLSDRELEVLDQMGRGRKTREIADALHLSIKTVQTHREHIKKKLAISDYVGLTRFAVQWVESEQRAQSQAVSEPAG